MNKQLLTWMVLSVCSFSFLGTTYVIKENGQEVGRWHTEDGSDDVKVIANAKKLPTPKSTVSDHIEYWELSGRLVDVLTLEPIGAAEILLDGGSTRHTIEVNEEGFFNTKAPQLKEGSYEMILMMMPMGYNDHIYWVKGATSLKSIPYSKRILWEGGVNFISSGIRGNQSEMQLGLYPLKLNEEQEADRKKALQEQVS